jgi:hypothetical protein
MSVQINQSSEASSRNVCDWMLSIGELHDLVDKVNTLEGQIADLQKQEAPREEPIADPMVDADEAPSEQGSVEDPEDLINHDIPAVRMNIGYGYGSRHWKERCGQDVRIPEYNAGLISYERGETQDLELTYQPTNSERRPKPSPLTDPEKLIEGGRIIVYKTHQRSNDACGALVMGVITRWVRSEYFTARTPGFETYNTPDEIKVYLRPITRVRPFDECVTTGYQRPTFQNVPDEYWDELMGRMQETM